MKIVFTFVYHNGYSSKISFQITQKEESVFDFLYETIRQKMKNRCNDIQDVINMAGALEGDVLISLNDIIEVKMRKENASET